MVQWLTRWWLLPRDYDDDYEMSIMVQWLTIWWLLPRDYDDGYEMSIMAMVNKSMIILSGARWPERAGAGQGQDQVPRWIHWPSKLL